MYIHVLKELEDARYRKLIRNRADTRCNHGDGWRLSGNAFMSMLSLEKNEYQNDRDQQTRHEDA